MGRLETKISQKTRRQLRVRYHIRGTTKRPRLSVHISNRHISAQLIDDVNSKTLASVTSNNKETDKMTMSQKAQWVGAELAKTATRHKISSAVLDRRGRLYHGRIKILADSARQNRLEI
jgi:large subunit ribosomal protein L18